MKKQERFIREAVAEVFDALAYKVRHGSLCESDLRAIHSLLRSGCGVSATAQELAEIYGQSEDNVRHIISRKVLAPPTRRVYYDFSAFADAVPAKWHAHHSLPAD